MAGEGVHIGHQLGFAGRCRRAAHAAAERDADAGRLALKRAEHQFAFAHQVETGPIEIGQLVEEQRRHIGHVGDEITLVADQRGQLLVQLHIAFGRCAFEGGGKE